MGANEIAVFVAILKFNEHFELCQQKVNEEMGVKKKLSFICELFSPS